MSQKLQIPSSNLQGITNPQAPTRTQHLKLGAWLFSGAWLLALGAFSATAQTPAFPGALGFGANATGGRNGSVYHVTTLADSGAGSFRTGVSSPNRIIVFDVGGYISLLSAVSVRENITIAGQTAPGGGIGFKGGKISFGSRNNIIARHIRIRPGSDTASDEDVALNLYNARNIIVDHVSIEFAPWNNVGAVSDDWQNSPVTDVTFQNCLNANPIHQQFGAHTESVNSTMAWFYTIFANSHNRNPMSKINDVFVNNVLYNCDAGYTTHTSTKFSHDLVNNYFIAGPASTGNMPWYQVDNNQSIYYSGNYLDNDENGVLGGGITTPYWYQGGTGGTVLPSPWSSLTSTAVLYSARAAYRVAVSQAGAFPRDSMDDLVINQVKTLGNAPTGTGAGTAGPNGSLYTSQTQTGLPNNGYGIINGGVIPTDTEGDGMPDYFEQANGFNLGSSDAMTIGADGYARIEKYINWLAEPHARTSTNTPVTVDLWQYTSGFTNNSPVYLVSNATNGSVTLSNSHIAVFTPTAAFIGMGGFQFRVTSADGSSYTNNVSIAISALQPPSNLIWQGDGGANIWTNGGPLNWSNGSEPVAFNAGDTVTFDDSGSSTPAINLATTISSSSISFVASQDYTIGGSGSLIGSGSLYKVGPGKLTLNTLNTFSGGVTINEGIVQLGDGVFANGSLSGNVTNNDTLILATPTGASSGASISGSGIVIKRGMGTHTLSGTQTYTNLTTIEAGTLTFSGTPPPGNVTNNGVLSISFGSSMTYAAQISGTGSLNLSASGQTITLATPNTHTGGTTNSIGTLRLLNNAAAGSGPIAHLAGGVRIGNGLVITNTFAFNGTTDLMLDTYGGGTATWAGNIVALGTGASFRPGGNDGRLVLTGTMALGNQNFIIPRGTVDIGGNANFSATGASTAFGRNTSANSAFVTIKDNAVVSLGRLSLGGDENTGGRVTVTIRDNAILSTGTDNFDLHLSDRTVAWTSVALDGGTLAVGGFIKSRTGVSQLTTNYFNGGVLKANKVNPTFLPALSGLICYVQAGGAKISSIPATAITIAQSLQHDPALGSSPDGGLTTWGAVALTGVNTYTGPTTILQGALFVNSSSTIATSPSIYTSAGADLDTTAAAGFTLSNCRLWGNGTVNGSITLGNGAVLAPGSNQIGRFTFVSPAIFVADSTNLLELSKTLQTNDTVAVWQTLTLGGTLVVTNLSGTLVAGDSFKLFDGIVTGDFNTVILPSLNPGLTWTNQLSTAGRITVISTTPLALPVFGVVSTSGTNLVMSGSNGTPNASFYTLAATNITLPASNWLRVATNQFDANGYFNLTNPIDPATPQLFYRLQLP